MKKIHLLAQVDKEPSLTLPGLSAKWEKHSPVKINHKLYHRWVSNSNLNSHMNNKPPSQEINNKNGSRK